MRLYREQGILLLLLLPLPMFGRSSWNSISSRVDKNFTQLVEFDGYASEVHHVTTRDGYVLSVFRVRSRDCSVLGGASGAVAPEPFVFTHGMYLSGDDCVIPGPRAAHCYLYADACRDVWVPNMRGSRYSRAHINLDPDRDAEYWNFSFEEMALYDLPSVIDYILKHTGQKQIVYIGHAQGAAILILLCAKRPEYNDKVKIGFGLSPTVSLSHSRFVVIEVEKILSLFLPWLDRTGRHFEIFSYGDFNQQLARSLCASYALSYPFCSALIFSFIGYNKYDIAPDVLPVVFGHIPSGTSAKNFLRWGQVANKGFTEYDLGTQGNLRKYGVETPPLFDLSKVSMRWVLMGSANDYIADLKDVAITNSLLANAQICVLSDRCIGHLDFIFGISVTKYIVPSILKTLDENRVVCL